MYVSVCIYVCILICIHICLYIKQKNDFHNNCFQKDYLLYK